jgi:hypothetical protein
VVDCLENNKDEAMTLTDMVKLLEGVHLRFYQGIFEASSKGVVHFGDSPEGALMNVVYAKNQAPVVAQGFVPRLQ